MAVCGLTRGSTEEDKVARRAGAIESKADRADVDADHLPPSVTHSLLFFIVFIQREAVLRKINAIPRTEHFGGEKLLV